MWLCEGLVPSHNAVHIPAEARNRAEENLAAECSPEVVAQGVWPAAAVDQTSLVAHHHKKDAETYCRIFAQSWVETAKDSHTQAASLEAVRSLAEDRPAAEHILAADTSVVVGNFAAGTPAVGKHLEAVHRPVEADSAEHNPAADIPGAAHNHIPAPAEPDTQISRKPWKQPPHSSGEDNSFSYS